MSQIIKIALFGESEKGEFQTAHFLDSLPQLVEHLGHPPEESYGIHFAVQSILYDHSLIYFRVADEGFSVEDYFHGIHLLKAQNLMKAISAICIPGVGNHQVIEAMADLCKRHSHVLITRESDLYDFLTSA